MSSRPSLPVSKEHPAHTQLDDERTRVSCTPKQYWPTTAFLGVSLAWSVKFAYVTPTFISLGVGIRYVGLVWFGGSAASIFIVPLVSASSDYTSNPWGRRRIFMIWFIFIALLGLLLFAVCERIGNLMGDTKHEQSNAIICAVIALVISELGLDGIQVMQRALVTDSVDADQLGGANAWFSFHGSLGRLLGYGLGSLRLRSLPGMDAFETETQALFTISTLILFFTGFVTLIMATERQFFPQLHEVFNTSLLSSTRRALFGVKTLPKAVRRAFISNLGNWSSWAILFYYGSDWMGRQIYGGRNDNEASQDMTDLYEQGVQAASFGYLLMASVASLTTFGLATISRACGLRRVWVFCLALAGCDFIGLCLLTQGKKQAAVALFAILGIPLAATYQLPWTEVTVAVRRSEDRALYCTLFRMSEVLPMAVMGLLSAALLSIFGGKEKAIFILASVLLFCSAIYTSLYVLDIDEIEEYEEED